MVNCRKCSVELNDDNWSSAKQKSNSRICNSCHNTYWSNNPNRKKRDAIHNANQLFINGEYIKKGDPRRDIFKPGRWVMVGDKYFNKKQAERGVVGFLYAIVNPAWPNWVKIGKATNAEKRLNSYQTSSPMRDYYAVFTVAVDNMSKAERKAHKKAAKLGQQENEWFNITEEQAIELLEEFCN